MVVTSTCIVFSEVAHSGRMDKFEDLMKLDLITNNSST